MLKEYILNTEKVKKNKNKNKNENASGIDWTVLTITSTAAKELCI